MFHVVAPDHCARAELIIAFLRHATIIYMLFALFIGAVRSRFTRGQLWGITGARRPLAQQLLFHWACACSPSLGRQCSVRVPSEGCYCEIRMDCIVLRRPNTAMYRIQYELPQRQGMKVCCPTWMMVHTIEGRMSSHFV